MLSISINGSETNCSCLGLSESGSAGGGVTGGGEVVVMLRIFFWNLGRSLTPALGGGLRFREGPACVFLRGTGASFDARGWSNRARNQAREADFVLVL